MVYALEMDDFRNVCLGGRFTLVSALKATFLA